MGLLSKWLLNDNQNLSTSADSYADLAKKGPQLLSGAFSSCAHEKWGFASSSEVSDKTGRYVRVVGDCRKCKESVVSIMERGNQP